MPSTCCFLGWLVALLAGNWLPGMLASLLYAVLPTHAEPVAWVAARMDVLSGRFVLGAMLALVFAQRRRRWGAAGGGLVVLAGLMLAWRIAFYAPALIFVQADDRYFYLPEMGSAALLGLIAWQAALWLRRAGKWLPRAGVRRCLGFHSRPTRT